MNEKPVNVRVAEALGHRVEQDTHHKVWLQFFHSTADGFERWSVVSDYEHSIAAAFVALEAFCGPLHRNWEVSTDSYEKPDRYCKICNDSWEEIAFGKGPTIPAAICQAILAASEQEAGRG